MNIKQKTLIKERIQTLKKQQTKLTVYAYVWGIIGLITILFGGFLLWIFMFICINKSKKLSKEIFELELKEGD